MADATQTTPPRAPVFRCAECEAVWRTQAQRDRCCTAKPETVQQPTPAPFDICDGRNRYEPCPSCRRDYGMGLTTRKGFRMVQCVGCGQTGPAVEILGAHHEVDRRAFDGWNRFAREAAASIAATKVREIAND